MRFSLDEKTLSRFAAEGTYDVRVRLVSGGCAGTKVRVDPYDGSAGLESFGLGHGVTAHVTVEDAAKLAGGKISRIEKNGKDAWIFTSPAVKSRCGCATSFSFEAKEITSGHAAAISEEKLAILKKAFGKEGGRTGNPSI